jgi:hypothetical protein
MISKNNQTKNNMNITEKQAECLKVMESMSVVNLRKIFDNCET